MRFKLGCDGKQLMEKLFVLIPFTLFGQVTFAASITQPQMPEDPLKSVTHCVGRFLIDLPADADYVGGSYDKWANETLEGKMPVKIVNQRGFFAKVPKGAQ